MGINRRLNTKSLRLVRFVLINTSDLNPVAKRSLPRQIFGGLYARSNGKGLMHLYHQHIPCTETSGL